MFARSIVRHFNSPTILTALCLMFVPGCGSSPPTPPAAGSAMQTLEGALNAWKEGRTIDDVKNGSPSVQVTDPIWMNGVKLTKYEVQGDGKPAGAQLAYRVKLWLTETSGKPSEKTVTYQVGTDPIFTVFRPMFE